VSRAKADMRSIATALEAYRIDWNWYPICGSRIDMIAGQTVDTAHLNFTLSTPTSYLTSVNIYDPFNVHYMHIWDRTFRYLNIDETYGPTHSTAGPEYYGAYQLVFGKWLLSSDGPDQAQGPRTADNGTPPGLWWAAEIYDATNGTVSGGDIHRSQRYGGDQIYTGEFLP
ncbi:hypothetical protein JXA47_04445, partial [Candidatus Sumerlaeota bacterium]|nr:hypothetical protein [Candidatus Sumerlaeota bacterium]